MTNTFADKLIGMQLVSWEDAKKTLVVQKGEERFKLVFDDSDEGDCCGYNEFFVELIASDDELKRNPVITNVSAERSGVDEDFDSLKITFLGESKKIMSISSVSGSGSGWCYGAIVTVKCEALAIDETVTGW